MNFSLQTKTEIIKRDIDKKCCKIALLSAFLRTATLNVNASGFGFEVFGESEILSFISKIITSCYKEEPILTIDTEKDSRSSLIVHSQTSIKILVDCKIISIFDDEYKVSFNIDSSLVKKECCKTAFVVGTFLSSGSITVPKVDNSNATGYHLQYVFHKQTTANDFCDLYASLGFFPKLIERNQRYVVYLKNAESINDSLTLMGAINSSLSLTDIIMRKEIKNKLNRAMNCEFSNMTKSIDASFSDRKAIQVIIDTVGLESLDNPLRVVAETRIKLEDKSLSEIASFLGISKSCLSHRLRKIREIAKDLED